MYDAIVIGKGPAGVSATLYILRAGFNCLVIGKDYGALEKAHKIENYYGFEKPISGKKLVGNGIKQALRLGAEVITDEVVGLRLEDCFVVSTASNDYRARAVVLASGSSRSAPRIKGLKEFEGRGVSFCAVCDAFFFKKKNVAVLGADSYALHELNELLPIAGSVCVLTNGKKPSIDFPKDVRLYEQSIESLEGEEKLTSVRLNDGQALDIDGLFVALGTADSSALAKKIGVISEANKIIVNEEMQTNIAGLFAAGDCTGGVLQISKAVYEGAGAGLNVIKYLRKLKEQ